MIALAANIVVRLLVADDVAQAQKARKLLEKETVWLGSTVLLEAEWVLRACYEFPPAAIAGFLRAVLGLPQVSVAEPRLIAEALRWYEGGMDFADALHVALAGESTRFVTFDRKLARKARSIQSREIQAL